MKKLVSLVITFAAVALLGTALTGAATDEASSLNEASAESAKQCCQDKTVDANRVATKAPQSDCCAKDQAKATVLAKTESCSGESCNSGTRAAGDCRLCATDVAATSNDKDRCRAANAGQCGQGAAAKLISASSELKCKDCPEMGCKGDCGVCTKAVSNANAGVQKCKSCGEEDCKEECSSCAAARKETEAADTNETASANGGHGMGRGKGMGHGHAGDSQHAKDHQDFFFLLEHRDSIRRTVKDLPNGVETLTESDAVDVASMIQTHVEAMYDRMEHANPIRMRDPIFREVFANAKKIKMEVEHTDQGVRVKETSDDAYVVKLVQEHAKVVSLWIKNGYSELPKNHAPPKH